jgi:integrase
VSTIRERRRSDGSIMTDGVGQTVWEVRAFVGRDPISRAPRQLTRMVHAGPRTRTGKPPREVTKVGQELEAEATKANGGARTSARTLGQLLERYLEHQEQVRDLSPQTMRLYRRTVRLYIEPMLDKIQVRRLTADHIDRLYARLIAAGKRPSTVHQVHVVLSGALTQAVKWKWVPANVAREASPPPVRSPPIVPPTSAEVLRLVEAAEARNPILAALVMLAALTGARRGELSALRWSDVDLDAGTLRISRSMIDMPGRVEEKATKTGLGRSLALGSAGVQLLVLHRDRVVGRAQVGKVAVDAQGFVFSERLDCSTPIRPDSITGFFRRVRDELNLPHVHLHSLRHFMATQLAADPNVSVRTLAGRLGHADASITLKVYSAFMPAADVDAAQRISQALARETERHRTPNPTSLGKSRT